MRKKDKFDIKTKKSRGIHPRLHFQFSGLLKGGLTVFISVLIIYGVAYAGTVTPPSGTPTAQFYSLSEIYNFITANTTATEGSPALDWSAALEGTGRTLTEIYDALASLISADKVKSGTTYLNVAGTLTPDGGTAAVADLFNGKTANLTADWTLDTGTLNLACNTATFDGTENLVANAYDGAGDGTNRWCVTDSGDAVAGDILSGKIAWVDGVAVTGTIDTQTLSAASETVSVGYYNATTLSAVDADLIAGNIQSGITIFGVAGSASAGYTYGDNNAAYVGVTATGAGTLLANLWNGSNTAGDFPGGSQAQGGVDDYNNNGTRPSDTYSKGWTACTSGNNYCGTYDTFADAKDDSTGLVWSQPCDGVGCSTFAEPASTDYEWTYNDDLDNDGKSASVLCSQTVNAGDPPTTPAAHGAGWSLPHQKQLMQAYIDGSWGNLEAVVRYYWSATTVSSNTPYAWYAYLSNGNTPNATKTNSAYVRCVR